MNSNLKDTFEIYDLKAKALIKFKLHNLGIPLISAKLYSAPSASFVVVNNQKIYHFDSSNEDKLLYDIQKTPRPGCELRVTSGINLVCYWKNVKKEPTQMFTSLKKLLTLSTALDDITFDF